MAERKPDHSEGHLVVSNFRRGDKVRITSEELIEGLSIDPQKIFEITDYEAGWMTDREDLPDGATALCVEIEPPRGLCLCVDDELEMVTPNPEFPEIAE